MKKHILSLMALTLTAALLAGCSNQANTQNPAQGGNSSTTQSASTTTESTTESTESTTSKVTSEPETRERFIYGEKEIPDIVYSNNDVLFVNPSDGRLRVSGMVERKIRDERTLESMVFETHTFGDYTIRLVGDDVRTDKEHFPGIIYMKALYVEVEKNGKLLPDFVTSNCYGTGYPTIYPVADVYDEYLLFEDQIGNYLDMYDTKNPVIAMRYFNYTDVDESLRKIVTFAWIEDDKLVNHFTGTSADNTCVSTGGYIEFSTAGFYSIFSADDFKVENENTLIDETAGVRYTFDFDKTDDSGHYFRTEKIG